MKDVLFVKPPEPRKLVYLTTSEKQQKDENSWPDVA